MQKYLLIIAGVFLFATFADAQTSAGNAADEAAIRANVGQMANGWNAKIGEQFAARVCQRRGLRHHQRNANQDTQCDRQKSSGYFRYDFQKLGYKTRG